MSPCFLVGQGDEEMQTSEEVGGIRLGSRMASPLRAIGLHVRAYGADHAAQRCDGSQPVKV